MVAGTVAGFVVVGMDTAGSVVAGSVAAVSVVTGAAAVVGVFSAVPEETTTGEEYACHVEVGIALVVGANVKTSLELAASEIGTATALLEATAFVVVAGVSEDVSVLCVGGVSGEAFTLATWLEGAK